MVATTRTFENGHIKLDRKYKSNTPMKVLITFLDEVEIDQSDILKFEDFSFLKSQQNLADFKGSLSDTVIEERRI